MQILWDLMVQLDYREYLTGFRKRNLKKKEDKRKKALERERLERLELRKQACLHFCTLEAVLISPYPSIDKTWPREPRRT